jgi:pimeloyl-ACP methyl ester carboxylesterase
MLMKNSVLTVLLTSLSGAMLASAQLPAPPPIDTSLTPYASVADSVTLPDGRQLHLVCMGKGSPTVIFTAGGNGWSGGWNHVQPVIAKITRTCAWDRPGFGLSDGVTGKPTVATTTADLEAALSARPIAGPYVMVGQSLGSFETLLFADRNPGKVAGIVLVDPSIPDQSARAARLRTQFHYLPSALGLGTSAPPAFSDIWRACADEVRTGALKFGGADPHGCLAMLQPPVPPAVISAVAAKLTSSPAQFATMAAFSADGLEDGQKIAINPKRNYRDIPLIILTATALPPGDLGEQRAYWEAVVADSTRAHDEMAALSSRGINTTIPGVGHEMQDERPQVVIDAIETVIGQLRGGKR